ncbi:hypothetical protein BGW80DRAFT_1266341 [Lactifluus volemus]|nr:hypothetical protein BGW80DRAFT_1266341 [Lactifluus volemus]
MYPSSYTCGGVGHLSRDCVQGSKCYNCSAIVSSPVWRLCVSAGWFILSLLDHRVT